MGDGGPGTLDELAERLALDLHRPLHTLSKGNRQKVGVVQAFMHEPELLVLDEPTSGLDPLLQREFRRLVEESRARGATTFLSSHVLREVEEVAGRVAIIRNGRLAVVEHVTTLKARAPRRLELDFAAPVPAEEFAALAGVRAATSAGSVVHCEVVGPVGELLRHATRHELLNVTSHEPDLEEIFLHYVEEEVPAHAG